MQLGIFMEEARPGISQAAAFRETLELADAAVPGSASAAAGGRLVGGDVSPRRQDGTAHLGRLRGMDIPELEIHLAAYRQAWREAGHAGQGSVSLRIPVHAAPTAGEALAQPREGIMYYFRRQAEFALAGVGRAGSEPTERRRAQAERLAALSYDEILRSRVVFGTAGSVVDRLAELRERLGLECVAVELNPGGLIPAEQVRRTLHILAHEVKPALG